MLLIEQGLDAPTWLARHHSAGRVRQAGDKPGETRLA
jgi:hypothetical protein